VSITGNSEKMNVRIPVHFYESNQNGIVHTRNLVSVLQLVSVAFKQNFFMDV
jgi:hypothetical protein